MLAEDATSCQWKLISGCCGLLPPRAPDLGRRLVGAGAPAAPGALATSAPLQSHPVYSGLPQGSRGRGVRVLDASRVRGKARGREFTTQTKASLSLRAPLVLQPTNSSLLFPPVTSTVGPTCFLLWVELGVPPPSWVALSFRALVCKLEIIMAPRP